MESGEIPGESVTVKLPQEEISQIHESDELLLPELGSGSQIVRIPSGYAVLLLQLKYSHCLPAIKGGTAPSAGMGRLSS